MRQRIQRIRPSLSTIWSKIFNVRLRLLRRLLEIGCVLLLLLSFNSLQFWFNSIQLLCNSMRRVCSLSVRQAPFKWGTTRQQKKMKQKKQQRFSQGMQHTRSAKRGSLHMAYILLKNQHWITTEDHQSYDQKVEPKNWRTLCLVIKLCSRDKLTISISTIYICWLHPVD